MPLLIGVILRMLGGLLLRVGPLLVSSVLRALGFAAVSFVGAKVAIDAVHNMVKTNVTGLPQIALQMVGLLKFDVAIEILFAAVAGRMALQFFNGTLKRFVAK